MRAAGASRWPWWTSQPPRTSGESAGSRRRASSASELLDLHGRRAVGIVGARSKGHLVLVEGDREQPDRISVEPVRDRAVVDELEVAPEARPGHREQLWIGGRDPQAVVAARGARGQLLPLEQRDRRAGARQLVRARRTDDPPAHDDDVRHAAEEPTPVRPGTGSR